MSVSGSLLSVRRRLSLKVRVSALLVFAVVLPLLITVIGSELILRPTLLSQATVEMGNDAQSHVQAIDALLIARLQDLEFLGQFFSIQKYLSGDQAFKLQAQDELALGYRLDANYSNWALFDTQSNLRLAYPAAPTPRGKYMLPPEIAQQLHGKNKTLISDVSFDDRTHVAFVDIYTSITSQNGTLLGFARSTLNLNDIWVAVNNETNAASGSFAMLLDGHGVRIAYTNTDTTLTTQPAALFKAIAPLPPQLQQRIKDENLYGNSHVPVTTVADPELAKMQENLQGPTTFQFVPASLNEPFQAYRANSLVMPWTYLVLRPINTITKAANQQDLYLILLAALVTLLAALVGLFVGRGLTRPILASVSSLLGSSQSLKMLADREQITSTEQKWIVESSQTGLQSVQYYAEATSVAAHQLDDIGQELVRNWGRLDAQYARKRLGEMIAAAHYIGKAASHQERSSKSLATVIRINTQVTEQLIAGATSAAEAANQLEEVVRQLRQVVGED